MKKESVSYCEVKLMHVPLYHNLNIFLSLGTVFEFVNVISF